VVHQEEYLATKVTSDTQTDKIIISLEETDSSSSDSGISSKDELLEVQPLP
jgi:hypothetical protein